MLLIIMVATIIIIAVLISKNKSTSVPPSATVPQMLHCTSCGEMIPAGTQYCPKCGALNENASRYANVQQDSPSAGFAVLSFFFPLIGLILYLVFKDQTPLKAKSCGMGALTGFITSVIFTILFVIIYVVFIFGMLSMYA
jgi:predicted RNA-binding Zn-ribbon protein involved in translation (DUF1610 family)